MDEFLLKKNPSSDKLRADDKKINATDKSCDKRTNIRTTDT